VFPAGGETAAAAAAAALDKDPSARAAFLDEACAGNQTLRRGVETLLRLHSPGGGGRKKRICGVIPPETADCRETNRRFRRIAW